MDAFSLALGLGLRGVSSLYEIKLSVLVAAFHVLMPLIGLYLGIVAGKFLGIWAARLGAVILIYIGLSFIIKGCREIRFRFHTHHKSALLRPAAGSETYGSIWLLSGSVSMDALSAGFGLGTFQMPLLLTVLTMGTVAGVLTWLGFLGGRFFNRIMGSYAQIMGGMVLIALAVKLLLA